VSRESLQGIRNASQYQIIGAYGAGLNFTSYNQVFSYLGEFYAPSAGLTLPYTTTGAGAGEIASFRSVGDAILRSDLAASGGSALVEYAGGTVKAKLDEISIVYSNLTPDLSDYSSELNAFAALLTNAKTGVIAPGVYPCSSEITFPKDAKLDASGVVFDFSGADTIGNFPSLRCVQFVGGSLTELASPSVAPTVGGYTLTFASPPVVSSDDVLILWDDTTSSWSGFRTYYTAGEFLVVRNTSGNDVLVNSPLIEGYPTSVRVFKMSPTYPKCVGLEVRLPTALTVTGIHTELSRNAEFHKVKATNTGINGISIARSVGFTVTACETTSDRSDLVANNYGLAIGNSQWGLVIGGRYEARRHGITMGGSSEDGSVPTRFIKVQAAHISSWASHCADMHGNVEFSTYDNCTMMAGVTVSGNNNAVRNCSIYMPVMSETADVAISINELRGTSFSFENLKVTALGDPATTGRGVIDCGGNSSPMTENTILGGVMSFRNIDLSAPNARVPIKISNRGSTAIEREIDVKINCFDSPTSRLLNCHFQLVSGTAFSRVNFDGSFPNSGAPAATAIAATRISGIKESGVATILTTATVVQDTAIVFNVAFPKAPSVRMQGNQSTPGVIVAYAPLSVTTTGFTARVYTVAGGAMAAGVAINLMWAAEIEE